MGSFRGGCYVLWNYTCYRDGYGWFRFSAEIVDPVLNRRLELSYKIKEI